MRSSRAISATVVFWKPSCRKTLFRYFDYQATRIPSLGFFFSCGFSFSSHVLIFPSSIGGTMILARVRRFPQMGLETDILFLSVT